MYQVSWILEVKRPKKVHDVRKVCLKTTLCVYACFVEFYIFVLDQIDVECSKLIYKRIWIGNVWVRFHVGSTRGQEEDPTQDLKLHGSLHAVRNNEPNVGQPMKWWIIDMGNRWKLQFFRLWSWTINQRDTIDGAWSHPWTVDAGRWWCCDFLPAFC